VFAHGIYAWINPQLDRRMLSPIHTPVDECHDRSVKTLQCGFSSAGQSFEVIGYVTR
jgi:hypothetical protein